ncbi:MAG TPA: helix-turn-helix domain-containing protein [Dyadobacter sp.]|jgi:AraC-like DNA-binding protein|nr:helix-turn-helix domain-containing protein [Dyadobacter sp.]
MATKQSIPLHFLSDDSSNGIHLLKIGIPDPARLDTMEAHRDDHCNFFFQLEGESTFMLDFRQIGLSGSGIFCIFPGQVHWPVSVVNASGWLLAVDMMLLGNKYREVFEEYVTDGDPLKVNPEQAAQLTNSLTMLDALKSDAEATGIGQQLVADMIQVCLGIFAHIIQHNKRDYHSGHTRAVRIAQQFRQLLRKEYKSIKSPAAYAHLLNITPSHLTEVVTLATGFSAGYWIQQEVMMEAKRLLYYTDLGAKEIAFSLGYDDHTYFSRLFKKVVGTSPGQFRKENHK